MSILRERVVVVREADIEPKVAVQTTFTDGRKRISARDPNASAWVRALGGHDLCGWAFSVPETSTAAAALERAGFAVPLPVTRDYDLQGGASLRRHQRVTLELLVRSARAFDLSDMGCGKTMSALAAFDFKRAEGTAKKMLVVAPLSTLDLVWRTEVETFFPHLKAAVLSGGKDRRLKLLAGGADIYVTNIGSLKTAEILAAVQARTDIDTVVVDEIADVARNPTSGNYDALDNVLNRGPERTAWALTGTPTPQGYWEAWALAKLMRPREVDVSARWFRRAGEQRRNEMLEHAERRQRRLVESALHPQVRFDRRQVCVLPPCETSVVDVPMSLEQARAYDDLMDVPVDSRGRVIPLDDRDPPFNETWVGGLHVCPKTPPDRMSKVLQICGGSVNESVADAREEKPDFTTLDVEERLGAAVKVAADAEGKTIVFVPYREAMPQVVDAMARAGFGPVGYDGSLRPSERKAALTRFMDDPACRVLVAQPRCMAHGLTLVQASVTLWFSAPMGDLGVYKQANARAYRSGQTMDSKLVRFAGCEVEHGVYEALDAGDAREQVLLDMLNGVTMKMAAERAAKEGDGK